MELLCRLRLYLVSRKFKLALRRGMPPVTFELSSEARSQLAGISNILTLLLLHKLRVRRTVVRGTHNRMRLPAD